MPDDKPQSETAARLAELIERSAKRAKELQATSEKMQALTDQLAAESKAATKKAGDARGQAKGGR